MLVLSRKLGERIVVGEGVVVTVLALKGKRIRLGIDAPGSVSIRRGELDRQDQENEANDRRAVRR